MSGMFKQLDPPVAYTNSNGICFGYVVRVQGLNRTTYLNHICGMQHELMWQGAHGDIISAMFKTIEEAFEAAERYYVAWGEEYEFEQIFDGVWRQRQGLNGGNCLETIESEVMEFI